MHAWVFRNRARLRLIYGPALAPCPPPALPSAAPNVPDVAASTDAGTVQRRARYVVIKPMPRRT